MWCAKIYKRVKCLKTRLRFSSPRVKVTSLIRKSGPKLKHVGFPTPQIKCNNDEYDPGPKKKKKRKFSIIQRQPNSQRERDRSFNVVLFHPLHNRRTKKKGVDDHVVIHVCTTLAIWFESFWKNLFHFTHSFKWKKIYIIERINRSFFLVNVSLNSLYYEPIFVFNDIYGILGIEAIFFMKSNSSRSYTVCLILFSYLDHFSLDYSTWGSFIVRVQRYLILFTKL